jgi:hypothetical protein
MADQQVMVPDGVPCFQLFFSEKHLIDGFSGVFIK